MLTAVTAFSLLLACQKEVKDPDIAIKQDFGMSIRRPPKNDEWDFKDKGFWANSQLVVAHKVDQITIDIVAQDKASGFGYFDTKEGTAKEFTQISTLPGVKDAKKIATTTTKLPGGGAGNVQANYLEMTFKKDDKPMELRMWCFVGKQNQNLYRIYLINEEGLYKKHQKEADLILSTLQIFKVK